MKYKTVPCTIATRVCGKFYLVTPDETVEISETAYICVKGLENGADLEDLCQDIEKHFEIDDRETLMGDVRSFVNVLQKKRLLMRCYG